jgi:integral membrane sensor domain MASE1
MLACISGFLSIWLPWLIAGSRKNMIDGMRTESLAFLFVSGLLCSKAFPGRPWIIAPASMAAFPVIAIIEIILDPSSHNLLPLEFICYGLMTLPALLGALLGDRLHRPKR